MAVVAIRRAEYTFGAVHLVAVEVSDGAVEIYRPDETGLEMFQGYVQDARLPACWRIRAVEALCAAPYFQSWLDRWGRRPLGQAHR